MKKILCIILALISVVSLAACSKDPGEEQAPQAADTKADKWPDNAFFKDIPSVGDNITFYNEDKNEKGYTYTFFADEMDYDDFRAYIAKLEEAGFAIYDTSVLSTKKTEDLLPEKLEDGTFNASWLGKRRGVYVAAQWYGDEYYKANDLPEDSNLRLVFYTYNAFEK